MRDQQVNSTAGRRRHTAGAPAYAGGGGDLMWGNSGDDELYCGPGRDTLSGGPGRNVVRQD
ncbi:hypothetical protein ACFCXS_31570 [Streptomyces sp. NPDC056373]|uniref:hypothetical protein n=1 Tax=Streptomyces sp. NPDC056373 TaxID=3345798 RepID=UPI0035D978F0